MGQCLCNCDIRSVSVGGNSYEIVRNIGDGTFSYIQLVQRGSQQYALKRIPVHVPERLEMVNREIKAHQTIQHDHIMPLLRYEIAEKGESVEGRLLFPYHRLGSVHEIIEVAAITRNPLPEEDILAVFYSLCKAVNEFHSHQPPYAHRDIKPSNLLLTKNNTAILMDLGSTRQARVQITTKQEAHALQDLCEQDCTAAYRAPELFQVAARCFITEKTDVWSLGCTLHAMAYGDSPCDGTALSAVSPRMLCDDRMYTCEFNKLIVSMLNGIPDQRPSVAEILMIVRAIPSFRIVDGL